MIKKKIKINKILIAHLYINCAKDNVKDKIFETFPDQYSHEHQQQAKIKAYQNRNQMNQNMKSYPLLLELQKLSTSTGVKPA